MCLARCFFHELEACVSHGASLRCLAHVAHAKSDASGPRPGPMSLFVSLMTCSLGKCTKLDSVELDTNYMLGQEQVPQPSEPQVPACPCQHLQTHAAKMHRSARNFSIKLQRYQARLPQVGNICMRSRYSRLFSHAGRGLPACPERRWLGFHGGPAGFGLSGTEGTIWPGFCHPLSQAL